MYPPPCRIQVTAQALNKDKWGNATHIIVLFGRWYAETKHFTWDIATKFYKNYRYIFNRKNYLKKIGTATVYKVYITAKDHEYTVVHNGGIVKDNKNWTCGCLGWKYRGNCRHIKALMEEQRNLVM